MIILILVGGCISQVHTEEEAEQIAYDYIRKAPTFSFDGVSKSLQITDVTPLESEGCYEVRLQFDCYNEGFGNRSDVFLVFRMTHHTARVRVEKGKVTRAIIDGIWDEMAQESIA